MRILLIDNGTRHLGQLEVICSKHQLDVIAPNVLTDAAAEAYDAVIISGNYDQSEAMKPEKFQVQLDLLQTGEKPVLGICLGFELICCAFDIELSRYAEQAIGAAVMTPTDEGAKLLQGSDPIRVGETIRWHVESQDLPKVLAVLAKSDSGVEAVKHKNKLVYGLQFCPEDFTYPSDGKLVYENILAIFDKAVKATKKATEKAAKNSGT